MNGGVTRRGYECLRECRVWVLDLEPVGSSGIIKKIIRLIDGAIMRT